MDPVPSLRERTETRFARGSSHAGYQDPAGPPERPTCPLDVTELIRLLDVEVPEEEVRSTRKLAVVELRTLGVIEGGELPSIAWAKAPRLSDLDDRLAPTMIVELADPPARPLHHVADDQDYAAFETEDDDDFEEIALTFELGAHAVAPKRPLTGFVLGIAFGLASVAAAFTALGVIGH